MLFLRSLETFISSREINLCRLDTFPTMVANRPVMYNRVPAFWTTLNSTLSAVSAIHKSQIGTGCLYRLQVNNRRCQTLSILLQSLWCFFQECRTDCLCEFVHFMWLVQPGPNVRFASVLVLSATAYQFTGCQN